MLRTFPYKLLLLLTVLTTVVVGCRKDLKIASWNVDLLAPVARGSLNLSDLIESDLVDADGDGLLHIVARDTLFRIGVDTLIGIPDTSIFNEFIVPTSSGSFPPGALFLDKLDDSKYGLNKVELVYAEIRESNIHLELTNTISEKILFNYTILSATKDGEPFAIEELIDAKSTFEGDYNLDGYEISFRGIDNSKVNTISTLTQARIDPNAANPYELKSGERFTIDVTFEKIIPDFARGFFGSQKTVYSDSSTGQFLPDVKLDALDISEFEVSMIVDNGVGADLGLEVSDLRSFNQTSGEQSSLEHQIIGSSFSLSRAVYLNDINNPVKHLQKTILFNQDNSNLDELIEVNPDHLIYDLELSINPLGNVSLGNDFVKYGHDLSATLELDVPLKVGVDGFVLQDTFAFSFADSVGGDASDQINTGNLRLYLENGYPLEAALQLYLLNEEGSIIDSLLAGGSEVKAAESGQVFEDYVLTESVIEIPVNQEKIQLLKDAVSVVLRAELFSFEKRIIPIYDYAKIEFRLIANLNVSNR